MSLVVSVLALVLGLVNAGGRDPSTVPTQVDATVTAQTYGAPVPRGFLGLSLEYWAIENYAGPDPSALDPVFTQLVRNLTPGQAPVLRIGGDSADWTWWPVAGMTRPPGVTFALDQRWIGVTRALTRQLGAHLILGLNLEANSAPLAKAEASALLSGLDPASVTAFELGNEPAQYGSFAWYRTAARQAVTGRGHGYSFTDFQHDFTRVAAQLPPHALAGPTTGGLGWMPYLNQFLSAVPQVRVLTVHHYPLQLCRTSRHSTRFPTLAHLLSDTASTGLAAGFTHAVAVAHGAGLPVRIDELNTVSCGAAPAVSQTFASSLWALDTLFALKAIGVDGVQMHTFPGAGYKLFTFRKGARGWMATVAPEYYGLLMFASAAPPGSHLLRVSVPAGTGLKVWATRGSDGRLRIVLINKDTVHAHTARLRLPTRAPTGRLERLQAPTAAASSGVTLGGQSFGTWTATGRLAAPRKISVGRTNGRYVVAVPAASAALLTLPGSA